MDLWKESVQKIQTQKIIIVGLEEVQNKYYLQDHRKSFKSESPISAAEKAFQFIRENNKLKNKSIKFTLEDRIKNKKYNFSARTRSNGENVVKKIRN